MLYYDYSHYDSLIINDIVIMNGVKVYYTNNDYQGQLRVGMLRSYSSGSDLLDMRD